MTLKVELVMLKLNKSELLLLNLSIIFILVQAYTSISMCAMMQFYNRILIYYHIVFICVTRLPAYLSFFIPLTSCKYLLEFWKASEKIYIFHYNEMFM